MSKRYYGLPSLTTLAAFESCARHLSFKQAAAELNVTPGAVSHQIKALEKEIGVPLFERLHRGVELTPAGGELFAVLASSFSQTASVLEKISSAPSDATITIGTSAAVASLWLMPRIGRLWQAHPELRINHRVSDRLHDLDRSDIDLVVRYGNGRWDGETAIQLFTDSVGPVCSPEFAGNHAIRTIRELPSLPLLQLEAIDTGWMTWMEWFALNGISTARVNGPRFNNYSIALQAAEEGAGVVLGWSRLIGAYLSAGRLVPLGDFFVPAPGAFHLTWNSRKVLDPSVELVRDWLVEAA
ncbi:LysR substrate-binding domain-containing protein [Hoeflea poritis]|uniref:LysR substrate-binding domain-containing protein n=1 Tax=Hoeflea poritis TaxID=2993659 RepID=A0ABT4VMV9_9HYPH|nr:LysR substrate-binding domain-containing protein [Hoeflea poritis]MDA4846050.1 LysR substrate-binding domain-containing protein [Hoeflea poritis]